MFHTSRFTAPIRPSPGIREALADPAPIDVLRLTFDRSYNKPFPFSAAINSGTSFTITPFWRLAGGA